MNKLIIVLMTSTILSMVSSSFAATMVYDKNDPKFKKEAGKIGTGVDSVAAAASAVPDGTAELMLVGHGEPGIVGMGSGDNGGCTKGLDICYNKLDDIEASLDEIERKLAKVQDRKNNVIVLVSCEVGKDKKGEELLKNLSKKLTKAKIFANKECVGLSNEFKKGQVCTVEGKTSWKMSSTLVGEDGSFRKPTRDDMKELNAASCAQ